MKVWLISSLYQEFLEGPITDSVEVVEKAEYDKLRATLEEIQNHEVVSYVSVLNAFKIYRNRIQEMAKEALDG